MRQNLIQKTLSEYWAELLTSAEIPVDKLPFDCIDNEDDRIEHFIFINSSPGDEWVRWKPKIKTRFHDFKDIEEKFGIQVHQEIKDYFNSFWFLSLGGRFGNYCIDLLEVVPGIELEGFQWMLEGCESVDDFRFFSIGSEGEGSHSVYFCNETGKIFLFDDETEKLEFLCDSLLHLLQGFMKEKKSNW